MSAPILDQRTQAGSPGIAYTLPHDAEEMAREFAEAATAPTLAIPLRHFLERAKVIEGLAALALALRFEPEASTLSVYAFSDLRAAKDGEPRANLAVDEIDRVHLALADELKRARLPFVSDLWFVPTESALPTSTVRAFARKLREETGEALQSIRLPVDLEGAAVTAVAVFAGHR